jgi:hypothetical protein
MSFRSHLNLSSICLVSLLSPLSRPSFLHKYTVLENFAPSNSKKHGRWTRFADRARSTALEGREREETQLRQGVNEWVVVAWSTRMTKTNDDSVIGVARWAGKRRTIRPNVTRRWKEAQFIESEGLIVKLLAIPIGHANFSIAILYVLSNNESLSKNRLISVLLIIKQKIWNRATN